MPTQLSIRSGASTHLQTRPPRILVLGAELALPQVIAYPWSDLPSHLNVEDYDVVILNLVSFLDEQARSRIRPECLPPWQQLARLLFSRGSEVVCIGAPPIDAQDELYASTTWWLPALPQIEHSSGQSIQLVADEFADYFQHVRRWTFAAKGKFKPHFLGLPHYLRLVQPQANHLQVGLKAIACNRAQQPIAFKLMFRVNTVPSNLERSRQGHPLPHQAASTDRSGTVIWLPPPTEIPADEAIQLLLMQRYGVTPTTQRLPSWLTSYKLPQHLLLEKRRAHHQTLIQRLTHDLATVEQQITALSRLQRLLYERHSNSLRNEVAYALRLLGAEIQRSATQTDALIFTSPTGERGIVLVRSRSGALRTRDLQHLHHLVQHRSHSIGSVQGILIANTEYDKSPSQRGTLCSRRFLQVAEKVGYRILSTLQLFEAIAAFQTQTLTPKDFWATVLNSNGIVPPFLESGRSPL